MEIFWKSSTEPCIIQRELLQFRLGSQDPQTLREFENVLLVTDAKTMPCPSRCYRHSLKTHFCLLFRPSRRAKLNNVGSIMADDSMNAQFGEWVEKCLCGESYWFLTEVRKDSPKACVDFTHVRLRGTTSLCVTVITSNGRLSIMGHRVVSNVFKTPVAPELQVLLGKPAR